MLYLNKSKDLLDSESYIYGKADNQKVLIPIHEFENFSSICPRCGKIIDLDIETIKDILEEDGEFENVNVYCEECHKIIKKNEN